MLNTCCVLGIVQDVRDDTSVQYFQALTVEERGIEYNWDGSCIRPVVSSNRNTGFVTFCNSWFLRLFN